MRIALAGRVGSPAVYAVGYGLIGGGGNGAYISAFHFTALFARRRALLVSILSTSFNVAGYSVGMQDISQKSASLIAGVTGGLGVMTGAASQVITGAILDANGRDFVPVFLIAAALQLVGFAGFTKWWDSERIFD